MFRVHTPEGTEKTLGVASIDPTAVVGDAHKNGTLAAFEGHGDIERLAAPELNGVLEEVFKDGAKAGGVAIG